MPKGSKSKSLPRKPISFELRELRGARVILDTDLAQIYGVTTKRLRQQYERNTHRFPPDFAFTLNEREIADLNPPPTTSDGLGVQHAPSIAFTELGAIMIATVLRCEETGAMCIFVIRAFMEMRHTLKDTPSHSQKLDDLEEQVAGRKDGHIETFETIFEDMKRLLNPERPKARRIGFVVPKK